MFKIVKMSFLSIHHQFVLMMVVLAMILVAAYSTVIYIIEKEAYVESSSQEMKTLSRALENDYATLILKRLPSLAVELERKWQSFPMIMHAELEDSSGHHVFNFSKQPGNYQSVMKGGLANLKKNENLLFFKHDVMSGVQRVGAVKYVVSNENYISLLEQLVQQILISMLIAIGLAIFLSLWLQKVVAYPVKKLKDAIFNINESGNYSAGIEIEERDNSEFAVLGRNFNILLKRMQKMFEKEQKSKAHANELTYYDELTGLPNRRLLKVRMVHSLGIAKRENRHGSLLFIGLDNFKKINDSHGHAAGDELLKQVAFSLKSVFRAEDTIARLGGDEFVILSGYLEHSDSALANQIHALMLKLKQILSDSFYVKGESYHLTASVGITTFPGKAKEFRELMKQADTAMYHAKEAGRDRYFFYEPEMQAEADAILQMENELQKAIKTDELELFYQPQVDEFGKILGVEALLRWFKKDGSGQVSPAVFIPVAERTGLIIAIGDWVIKKGFQQLKQWESQGIDPDFSLSINISPYQFHQEDFVETVIDSLIESDVSAKHVTLEVTEGIVIEDIQSTIGKMKALTTVGIQMSLDDFGTGYSSLAYLKKLPLSELKIDQSFVRDLHIDKADGEIAATIIAMAQNLNLDVVAEGVEEESQLRFLRQHGCTIFQGYYFHKPMPQAELTKLLFEPGCVVSTD
ncbi:MAG: EAL domain-containing protein [Cycloclasticus sp.]